MKHKAAFKYSQQALHNSKRTTRFQNQLVTTACVQAGKFSPVDVYALIKMDYMDFWLVFKAIMHASCALQMAAAHLLPHYQWCNITLSITKPSMLEVARLIGKENFALPDIIAMQC